MNKTQLRRISAIVKVLNTGETMKQEVLRLKVIDLIDRDFCKSTLEKDIQYLKMDFDLEFRKIKIAFKSVLITQKIKSCAYCTAFFAKFNKKCKHLKESAKLKSMFF